MLTEIDVPVEVPEWTNWAFVFVNGMPWVTWSQVAFVSTPAWAAEAATKATAPMRDKNNRLRIG
jgi:hypothetical protein